MLAIYMGVTSNRCTAYPWLDGAVLASGTHTIKLVAEEDIRLVSCFSWPAMVQFHW